MLVNHVQYYYYIILSMLWLVFGVKVSTTPPEGQRQGQSNSGLTKVLKILVSRIERFVPGT